MSTTRRVRRRDKARVLQQPWRERCFQDDIESPTDLAKNHPAYSRTNAGSKRAGASSPESGRDLARPRPSLAVYFRNYWNGNAAKERMPCTEPSNNSESGTPVCGC